MISVAQSSRKRLWRSIDTCGLAVVSKIRQQDLVHDQLGCRIATSLQARAGPGGGKFPSTLRITSSSILDQSTLVLFECVCVGFGQQIVSAKLVDGEYHRNMTGGSWVNRGSASVRVGCVVSAPEVFEKDR